MSYILRNYYSNLSLESDNDRYYNSNDRNVYLSSYLQNSVSSETAKIENKNIQTIGSNASEFSHLLLDSSTHKKFITKDKKKYLLIKDDIDNGTKTTKTKTSTSFSNQNYNNKNFSSEKYHTSTTNHKSILKEKQKNLNRDFIKKKKFSPLHTSTNIESRFLKGLTSNFQKPAMTSTQTDSSSFHITCIGDLSIGSACDYLSEYEARILKATSPIDFLDNDLENIALSEKQKGIWLNKDEVERWNGDIPLSKYEINQDDDPCVITKKIHTKLEYIQEMAIRYLQPPTPSAPGDIIIEQKPNILTPPAPPLVIRQAPARPPTPEPIVFREAPPQPPPQIGRKIITIYGKKLPPPPRKVVIERFAPLPPKPPAFIIERWLPFKQQKRRVILQKSKDADPVCQKPKNYIIQWEPPKGNYYFKF
jgi:hypothetical protein